MKKYEAEIRGYYFSMSSDTDIEVRIKSDDELPIYFINVNPGSIRSEKDFHYEIMDWYAKSID